MLPTGWRRSRPGQGLKRPYYDVQGVTVHGALRCVILGEEILHGNAHYVTEARRHVPCSGGKACHWCLRGMGKRRKGYVSAITTGSRQPFVLELTDAALNVLDKAIEEGVSLRGLRVRLERAPSKSGSRSKTAKVLLHIEGTEDPEKIPAAFDETPHLEKMWGLLDDSGPEPEPEKTPQNDYWVDE